jgi:hypothetical protein
MRVTLNARGLLRTTPSGWLHGLGDQGKALPPKGSSGLGARWAETRAKQEVADPINLDYSDDSVKFVDVELLGAVLPFTTRSSIANFNPLLCKTSV